ncbi:hypothetical protein Tco_0269438 [Tanacetum coccineum]
MDDEGHSDNDDEDDEYDDRDVDGDDGDQYRLAKEQEDQLNSEIRSLDMAGTFLPLTIKSLEEVNMEQERDDHVTTVKVDTLKLIVQSPKHPLRCHLADFFRNLVIIDGECEHPTNDFTSSEGRNPLHFIFGQAIFIKNLVVVVESSFRWSSFDVIGRLLHNAPYLKLNPQGIAIVSATNFKIY